VLLLAIANITQKRVGIKKVQIEGKKYYKTGKVFGWVETINKRIIGVFF